MGFSELSYCANITFLRHFYIVGSAFSSTFFEWLYRVSTCGIDREIEWFVVFSAFWVFLGATRVKFTCPNYYGIGCISHYIFVSHNFRSGRSLVRPMLTTLIILYERSSVS